MSDGVRSLLRFRILTLMISVAGVCLLISLNVRETTTITEPYYAPLMGAVRHPPPYDTKEMAVSVYIDRGWPLWHTRESMNVMSHNAALYIDDYGTPNATPRVGGSFGLRDHASLKIRYVGIAVDVSVALFLIAALGFVSEVSIRRLASKR